MLQDADFISPAVRKFLDAHGFSREADVASAGSAGSGRGYFRVSSGEKSVLVQTNPEANEDFFNYAQFSEILRGVKVRVPQIFFKDKNSAQLVIEDFGTRSLFDEVFPLEGSKRASACVLYDQVIRGLVSMQAASRSVFASHPSLAARKFDYASLKWETSYFAENYLEKLCQTGPLPQDVKTFFAMLSCAVDMQPKVLMHRDFQSQNIMVLDNAEVGFIDFQGLRRGSQYYDLASLLWDPYVQMPTDLVVDFFKKWSKNFPGTAGFTDEEIWISFLAASLQRLMQALGAYCFLSTEKGIQKFSEYIEPGKKRLLEVLMLYREYSSEKEQEAIRYLCEQLFR